MNRTEYIQRKIEEGLELTFRERLEVLPREELVELVKEQDLELWKQVRRIEWVFSHKLNHLAWNDGTPITGRKLTNQELALLIDEPFRTDPALTRSGLGIEDQRRLHIARDPVL